jgi:hypothetical protein
VSFDNQGQDESNLDGQLQNQMPEVPKIYRHLVYLHNMVEMAILLYQLIFQDSYD